MRRARTIASRSPWDDGVAQRGLGVVVGRRQIRVFGEGDDRLPIGEDFTREGAHFLLQFILIALTIPADFGDEALDGGLLIALRDPLNEPALESRARSRPKPEPAAP